MERLLLWFDEIDDAVAIWAHRPGRIRRHSLQAGLAAALALALLASVGRPALPLGLLCAASVLALGVWVVATLAELAPRRGRGRRRRAA